MTDKSQATVESEGLTIIGAGFGRTGTLSLKAALEELGFGPCYHMTEVFSRPEHLAQWEAATHGKLVDWRTLFQGYRATVDWPGCTFYAELMQVYPGAKVLLSVRDPESWYESVRSTIYQVNTRGRRSPLTLLSGILMRNTFPRMRQLGNMVNTLVWQGTFGGNFEDKQHALAVFQQHIEEVKRRVPPEKLLVYNVKEGWEPLCAFLGVEVPRDKPFPRLNDRDSFVGNRMRQTLQRRALGALLAASLLVVVLFLLGLFRRYNKQ